MSDDNDTFQPSLMYSGSTGAVKGSDTSERHAKFEKQRAPTVQSKVLNAIILSHAKGCTSADVEYVTGLKHQSASAAIRNLELDGKVVKTVLVRDNQHAYVSKSVSAIMRSEALLSPNPRRVSYKTRYEALTSALDAIVSRHRGALDERWVENRPEPSAIARRFQQMYRELLELTETSDEVE